MPCSTEIVFISHYLTHRAGLQERSCPYHHSTTFTKLSFHTCTCGWDCKGVSCLSCKVRQYYFMLFPERQGIRCCWCRNFHIPIEFILSALDLLPIDVMPLGSHSVHLPPQRVSVFSLVDPAWLNRQPYYM